MRLLAGGHSKKASVEDEAAASFQVHHPMLDMIADRSCSDIEWRRFLVEAHVNPPRAIHPSVMNPSVDSVAVSGARNPLAVSRRANKVPAMANVKTNPAGFTL